MARVGRPLFKPTNKHVAVRTVRHKGKIIQPGEPVEFPNFRTYHMRSLYQRRRIGIKGHPWTEQALATPGMPLPFVSDTKTGPQPRKSGKGWIIPEETAEVFGTKADAAAWLHDLQKARYDAENAKPPASPVGVKPEKGDDGAWRMPKLTAEVFDTRAKAVAWLKAYRKAVSGG